MSFVYVNNKKGFSLIELMVTVAIIAVISSIAIPIYQNYVSTAKKKSAESVLEQIPILLETYRAENGRFPLDGTYNYTESDSGVISDGIGSTGTGKAGLIGFTPRKATQASDEGILYHYQLEITGSGTTSEKAKFFAIPQSNRGAPPGNIPSPAAEYE